MDVFVQRLRETVAGDVRDDERTLRRFSTDYSIYDVRPRVVVVPRDVEDIVETVRLAQDAGVPVTPRGGGSSTAGSALGRGIVLALDGACGMNAILGSSEIPAGGTVTVECGVRHDVLQAYLRERGWFLPADPSSDRLCYVGGNVATKASGPHALKHGSIDRYVKSAQVVSADGKVFDSADAASIPATLLTGVTDFRKDLLENRDVAELLRRRRGMKCASGYNLGAALGAHDAAGFLSQLLVGSAGTLGIVTRVVLQVEPYEEGRATTLLFFLSLEEAAAAVCQIREHDVAAIEIMNAEAVRVVRMRQPGLDLPDGDLNVLLVEYTGHGRHDQMSAVQGHLASAGYRLARPPVTVDGAVEQAKLWRARKSLLPAIRHFMPGMEALSVVNDVGVDVRVLAAFVHDAEKLFRDLRMVAPIYGHAGSGNLHLRPFFDVRSPDLGDTVQRVADAVYAIVRRHGGTITAEHGMGRLRAPYLEGEWGVAYEYLLRVKQLFDPQGTLNPGVMFSNRPITEDMRRF